jgi:hypothetical protein
MPRINSLNTFVSSSILNTASGGGVDPEESNYASATMVFIQGTAPTGWVKDTSDNDYTLRCVTGAASSGGVLGFATVMTTRTLTGSLNISGSVGPKTLTVSEMATHTHVISPITNNPYIVSPTTGVLGSGTAGLTRILSPGFYTGSMAPNPTSPGVTAGTAHAHPENSPNLTNPTTFATVDLRVKYVEAILATRT